MPEPISGASLPWLAERARRNPDAEAIRFEGDTLTFGELAWRVEDVAARLAGHGVGPGDRIAVAMETSLRWVEILHAAQRLGATLVPLNVRLTASETALLLADAEPRLVLYDDAHEKQVAVSGAPRLEAYSALDGAPREALPDVLPLDPRAIHTILYTSGTTGQPKGAMLSNASHQASAVASRANLGVAPGDRWLLVLPLHHVGGLSILLRSVVDGVPVVLQRRFDVEPARRSLRDDGVTLVSLVPTMLQRLLDGGEVRWPGLRAILLGGASAGPELVDRALRAGLPIAPTYGLTEAASQVATLSPGETGRRRRASGRPLPGTEVRIAPLDSADATAEEPASACGEILVRGPTVMEGYFRRPDATRDALRGGWLHTGDVGRFDDDGYLEVLDRRSDLIVSGGENVYPAEVEAVLETHPDVLEAGVYGESDPEWGRRVVAAVVPRAGRHVDETQLIAWCDGRLAGFKRPRRIEEVKELPHTASGKLRRHRLARSGAD